MVLASDFVRFIAVAKITNQYTSQSGTLLISTGDIIYLYQRQRTENQHGLFGDRFTHRFHRTCYAFFGEVKDYARRQIYYCLLAVHCVADFLLYRFQTVQDKYRLWLLLF